MEGCCEEQWLCVCVCVRQQKEREWLLTLSATATTLSFPITAKPRVFAPALIGFKTEEPIRRWEAGEGRRPRGFTEELRVIKSFSLIIKKGIIINSED